MVTRRGIVLKHINPTKQVCLILDSQCGVQAYVLPREGICMGAYIEYTIREQRIWTVADDIELIALPYVKDISDLLLFHRVFDICSTCMPIGSSSPGVFEHICTLYHDRLLDTTLLKKIFLCRLLTLLGFYPHEKKFQSKFFLGLISQSFETGKYLNTATVQENDVEEWLLSCLALHMHDQRLKTLHIGEWMEIS
jgi:hypothetical protein